MILPPLVFPGQALLYPFKKEPLVTGHLADRRYANGAALELEYSTRLKSLKDVFFILRLTAAPGNAKLKTFQRDGVHAGSIRIQGPML